MNIPLSVSCDLFQHAAEYIFFYCIITKFSLEAFYFWKGSEIYHFHICNFYLNLNTNITMYCICYKTYLQYLAFIYILHNVIIDA